MHWRRHLTIAAAVALASLSAAAGSAAAPEQAGPMVIEADSYALSEPVRDLTADRSRGSRAAVHPRINPLADRPGQGRRGTSTRGDAPADPLAAPSARASGRTPAPGLVFEGIGNPEACGSCLPPDTVGDVSPTHYIQMVNATKVGIFDKSTGALVVPAFDLSELWPSSSVSPCRLTNRGDPVPVYDPLADRWVLSQFFGNPPSDVGAGLCFAVSQTADPTGAYHLYQFNTPEFPDYFKVGAWPTGYYVSSNETSGYRAYALDRTKMLAGDSTATAIRSTAVETNFLLPADVDGPTAPAPQGGLFYTFKDNVFHGGGGDRLELFQLTPDFAAGTATFGLIATVPVAPFVYTVCGFFVLDCIPQPGTAEGLDAVSEWPMHRFAYRRFSGREALVGNFTVDGPDTPTEKGAVIRWFELRNTGSGWTLFQEGSHDPGAVDPFMGSIAMDQDGNIALGYSVSSEDVFPSIRYATRNPGDPPGTLQAEQTLQAGGGSQTSTANRWGDYSAMTVDPADDCTFWYTNEYYPVTASSTWKTKIGNFKEPTCPLPDADNDGIPDPDDACPNVAGLPPDGCPSNAFTIGKAKRNKKRGTAKLSVTFPGAGDASLSGKGIKPQRPLARTDAAGTSAKPVLAAGTIQLKIKPTGKTKKKLRKKGKAKVRPRVTFTPTGGLPNTQTTKVKLKKRLKKK